jgi:DHA1 family tetracycline resistance protein-like MFS transporter
VTGLRAEVSPAVAGTVPVRRAALAFIFVTVALDMLSLGIIAPVLPKLVLAFEGGNSASAAAICGLFGTVFSGMQFVFAPLLGALSDRFGRRPVILLSNLALAVDYVIVALAPTVAWLFVGRVLSGICGASYTPAGAYIADVTLPERRAAGFGLISAAFGFGFVVGPALGGLAGSVNPRLPFWIAAGLSLTNTLYGLLVLPESLPVERRALFQWKRANPVGALMLLRSHAHVLGLAGVAFVSAVAHEVQPSLFVLYTDYRYGWDTRTVGLVLAAVGVMSAVVGAGLVRVAVERLGERRTLLLGLAFGACGFALYGLAPTGAVFFAGVPLLALWGLAGPSGQSLMTQHVDPSEQGRLQGAISGVQGVAFMIGPVLFTAVYAAFIGTRSGWQLPGAPFLLAALLLATGFAVAWRVTRR